MAGLSDGCLRSGPNVPRPPGEGHRRHRSTSATVRRRPRPAWTSGCGSAGCSGTGRSPTGRCRNQAVATGPAFPLVTPQAPFVVGAPPFVRPGSAVAGDEPARRAVRAHREQRTAPTTRRRSVPVSGEVLSRCRRPSTSPTPSTASDAPRTYDLSAPEQARRRPAPPHRRRPDRTEDQVDAVCRDLDEGAGRDACRHDQLAEHRRSATGQHGARKLSVGWKRRRALQISGLRRRHPLDRACRLDEGGGVTGGPR